MAYGHPLGRCAPVTGRALPVRALGPTGRALPVRAAMRWAHLLMSLSFSLSRGKSARLTLEKLRAVSYLEW